MEGGRDGGAVGGRQYAGAPSHGVDEQSRETNSGLLSDPRPPGEGQYGR